MDSLRKLKQAAQDAAVLTPPILQPHAKRAIRWLKARFDIYDELEAVDPHNELQHASAEAGIDKETLDHEASLTPPQMEVEIAPDPPSPAGSDFSIVSDGNVIKTKVRLSPSQEIEKEIQMAVEAVNLPPWKEMDDRRTCPGPRDSSEEFKAEQTEEQKKQRERIANEWANKENRPFGHRRRIRGGTEDVEEGELIDNLLGMMEPTLQRQRSSSLPQQRQRKNRFDRLPEKSPCAGRGYFKCPEKFCKYHSETDRNGLS